MQRWQVTSALAGIALVAAALAPRLFGATPPTPPTAHVTPPTIVAAPQAPTAPSSGHLVLDAGLDRTAILAGSSNERFLVITVSAPESVGKTVRRPVDMAVVMDTSGSMTGAGKIDYAKKSARYLADHMASSDTFSLVTFADTASVRIPAGPVRDLEYVHAQIDRIQEGGGTNIHDGLSTGALEALDGANGENSPRIVLLSDGNPTVGVKDEGALARKVAELHGKGITVSVVGLGLDYNEDLLQRLADAGGGSYDFVDQPSDLQAVFHEELEKSASLVAQNTKVNIGWDSSSGVELLDVVGWDEQRWIANCFGSLCSTGFSVDMGEVTAGQVRKIVARVRINAGSEGDLALARATLTYDDLIDGTKGMAQLVAKATVTDDAVAVENSMDRGRTKGAALAWGNEQTQLAARAYATGNVAEAEEYAAKGQRWFEFNAASLEGDMELAANATRTQEMRRVMPMAPASSPEAQRVVKQAKEDYLDYSR